MDHSRARRIERFDAYCHVCLSTVAWDGHSDAIRAPRADVRPLPSPISGDALGPTMKPEVAPPNDASAPRPVVRRFAQPTPLPVGDVNVYVVPGQVPAVVDTGPDQPGSLETVVEALVTCGYRLTDVRAIVLTHSHVDHCGLAGRLQEATGARVLAHPAALPILADYPAAWRKRLAFYERATIAGGVPERVRLAFLAILAERGQLATSVKSEALSPLVDGARHKLGDAIWTVLHTPGHADDHLCLVHEPSGTMFCGDLLLRFLHTVPVLAPRPAAGRRRALQELRASWRAVGRLPISLAWPGHGPPIRAHGLLVARRHLTVRSRLRACEAAVRDGAATVWEVARAIGLSADPALLDLTLSEAAALLDWLVGINRLQRQRAGEIVRFAPPSASSERSGHGHP